MTIKNHPHVHIDRAAEKRVQKLHRRSLRAVSKDKRDEAAAARNRELADLNDHGYRVVDLLALVNAVNVEESARRISQAGVAYYIGAGRDSTPSSSSDEVASGCVTTTEAARMLGVSRAMVGKLVQRGLLEALPYVGPGRRKWMVPRAAVEARIQRLSVDKR